MWKPDVVIYHDKCIDGFTAAWVCWKRWPEAEFIATNYGRTFSDEGIDLIDWHGKNLLIVDFSYPRAALDELLSVWDVGSIVVLDHHKTAEAELAAFRVHESSPGALSADDVGGMLRDLDELGRPRGIALFDMERSGAGMAWDFAMQGDRPGLVNLVEDRDLWLFKLGDDSRHLNLALSSIDRTFAAWNEVAFHVEAAISNGRAMARYRDSLVTEIIARAWLTSIDGMAVITVDAPYDLVSEVGHRLLALYPAADFAAMSVRSQFATTFSLRSDDSRVDVSQVAKKYGGGGHRNAAGFRVPN